jgi:hypothetical protein
MQYPDPTELDTPGGAATVGTVRVLSMLPERAHTVTDREQEDLRKAVEGAKRFLDETIGNHELCAIHRVVEPFVEGRSTQCFECKHVYFGDVSIMTAWTELVSRSEDQFMSAIKMATVGVEAITTADDVPFCPLCLHDW